MGVAAPAVLAAAKKLGAVYLNLTRADRDELWRWGVLKPGVRRPEQLNSHLNTAIALDAEDFPLAQNSRLAPQEQRAQQ